MMFQNPVMPLQSAQQDERELLADSEHCVSRGPVGWISFPDPHVQPDTEQLWMSSGSFPPNTKRVPADATDLGLACVFGISSSPSQCGARLGWAHSQQ